MPSAKDKIDNNEALRKVLGYGPHKCKKTWWSLRAAELGFNVILLDGEHGWEIVNRIDKKYHHKIQIVDVADTSRRDVMAYFLTTLLRGKPFLWDEQARNTVSVEANVDTSHSHYVIDPNKLTRSDVLVVDSWSAVVSSLYMRYFMENNVDLYEDFTRDDKRGEFGWTGALAHWLIERIVALPCHIIVLGHENIWEKRATKRINGKSQEVVEFSRLQIMSTSGPNARGIPRNFSDILWFKPTPTYIEISVEADPDSDAGSRVIEPGKYKWQDMHFGKFCEAAHSYQPTGDEECEAFKWLPAGAEIKFENLGLTTKSAVSVLKGKPDNAKTTVQVDKPVLAKKPNIFAKKG